SLIAEGCNIYGTVDFSVLFSGVTVEADAQVRDSIVMPGAVVKKGAVVQYAIVAEDAVIGENSVVGMRPEQVDNKGDWGIAVIGGGAVLPAGSVVKPKEMVDVDHMEG
ncbi:MAG: glucose-1-phosphate adenylyltransferase, partial [Acetanaerobacterium sp.]